MSQTNSSEKAPEIFSQISFREPMPTDMPLIYSSWLKSYRFSEFAKGINKTTYFREHHKVIEDLLATSTTILACDVNDPSNIFGYITVAKINDIFTVHYVYVKHTYRRFGIAKMLLNVFQHEPGTVMAYTHETAMAKKLSSKFNFTYNPYLMIVQPSKLDEHETENEN